MCLRPFGLYCSACLGIWKIKIILENVNQITFNFVEEGPGRGYEDIKKECNVNCFDFFFFSISLMEVMGGNITINLTH